MKNNRKDSYKNRIKSFYIKPGKRRISDDEIIPSEGNEKNQYNDPDVKNSNEGDNF